MAYKYSEKDEVCGPFSSQISRADHRNIDDQESDAINEWKMHVNIVLMRMNT